MNRHEDWPDILQIGDQVKQVNREGEACWWTCVGWNGHNGDLEHQGMVTQAIMLYVIDTDDYANNPVSVWSSVGGLWMERGFAVAKSNGEPLRSDAYWTIRDLILDAEDMARRGFTFQEPSQTGPDMPPYAYRHPDPAGEGKPGIVVPFSPSALREHAKQAEVVS